MPAPVSISPDEGVFNALTDPWIPVQLADDGTRLLSLRDALALSPEYLYVAPHRPPLERDAITRLLIAVASYALTLIDPDLVEDAVEDRVYPTEAAAALQADWFWLRHPTHPFCQDWHESPSPTGKHVRELAMLDVHTPGSSSSQWAQRRPEDDLTDHARVTALTAAAWWHTLRSNGADKTGAKFASGAPGQVLTRTMSLYNHSERSFAETLLANIRTEWVTRGHIPAFLAQHPEQYPSPQDFASPTHLWRATWATNRPLLHWSPDEHGSWRAVSWEIGPTAAPLPGGVWPDAEKSDAAKRAKAADPELKQILKDLHLADPSLLIYDKATKAGAVERVAATPADGRLRSTEGFLRWYKLHLETALADWGHDRLLSRTTGSWAVAVFITREDGKNNRVSTEYDVLPLGALTAPVLKPDGIPGPGLLTAFIDTIRSRQFGALKVAFDGAGDTDALLSVAQRALYESVEGPLVLALTGVEADLAASATQIRRAAARSFASSIAPLMANPATRPNAVAAESRFLRALMKEQRALNLTEPEPSDHPKESA